MGWGFIEAAADAVGGAATSVVNTVIVHPAEDVGNAFVDAANVTAQGVTEAANWTAQAGEDAVTFTGNLVIDGANITAKGFNDAGSWVGGAAESAWAATSDEAEAIGHGVESAGIIIGTGLVIGAEAAAEGIKDGAEYAGEGLVAVGEYVTQHVCDLAMGAAIAGVMSALSAEGEEEEATGAVAVACAMGDSVALDLASVALAKVVVEPIYFIPGVSDALGHKDDVEDVISFVVCQACEENKETVIASAGQFLAGVLLYALTSAVCEGKVPGGFELWKGVQAEMET